MPEKHPYTMPKVAYDKASAALNALQKKFPLSDPRKQDISDIRAIKNICVGVSPQNYEPLADLAPKIARLKSRLKENEKLAKDAYHMMARLSAGPFEKKFGADMRRKRMLEDARMDEDEKSREITKILLGQIGSMTKGAELWSVLRDNAHDQKMCWGAIMVPMKDANKAIKKKIGKSKKGVKHLKLATKLCKDLVEMEKLCGSCMDSYILLESELRMHVKDLQKGALVAGKMLIKMKAKSAMDFLQKIAA